MVALKGRPRRTTSAHTVPTRRNSARPTINKATPPTQRQFTMNDVDAYAMRRDLFQKMIDPRRDIDSECGYPSILNAVQYRLMWDREGVAQRIVNIYPEECWAQDPEIKETEDQTETAFEKAWEDLDDKFNFWHYLQRIDILSGIGHYGVILIGLDDGLELEEPAAGVNLQTGEKEGNATAEITYLRCFDETMALPASYETDKDSPRYGYPDFYNIKFVDLKNGEVQGTVAALSVTRRVHWTRVIHVADNRTTNEIYGIPRMQQSFNRVYDLRKILSGSGEMFWKGGFPGYSFEVDPAHLGEVELDQEKMQEAFFAYSNGLQRYLGFEGVHVNSLAPQVADPGPHVKAQVDAICVQLACPTRIFLGSEEAKLASGQDIRSWNKRLAKRQKRYLTPMLIRPFVDRLIAFGVLPEPKEYMVDWPDLAAPTDEDIAKNALAFTQAAGTYVTQSVNTFIPEVEYLTEFWKLPLDRAQAIVEAAQVRQQELADEQQELEDEQEEEPGTDDTESGGSGTAGDGSHKIAIKITPAKQPQDDQDRSPPKGDATNPIGKN